MLSYVQATGSISGCSIVQKTSLRGESVTSTAAQQAGSDNGPSSQPTTASAASGTRHTADSLPTQPIWSDVPTPAKLLGLGGGHSALAWMNVQTCRASDQLEFIDEHNYIGTCHGGNLFSMMLACCRSDSFHCPFTSSGCQSALAAS